MNDMDDLIGKVLAKEASGEEEVILQNWMEQSDSNRKYVEQISLIFDKAAANHVQTQFDTDAAWKNVKTKIHSEKKSAKFRNLNNGFQVWRIAAGIVILVSAGVFAYQWLNPRVETFAVASDATTVQDTLPDGSHAFLNKNSSLTYEYNPRKKTRQVKLKGESFFDIKHEEEKPFVIEAEDVLVRDIGTTFNIKAYPDRDTVEVVVKTGEVQFYTLKNPGLNLVAGETGFYSKKLREFSKIQKADTNVLAYKTGVFSFNKTDLKSSISKINEVYGSHIILANEQLGNCSITVNFNNDKLETVIEVIAESLKLTVTRKDNQIILDGPGCD